MDIMGLCSVCGKPEAIYTCSLCGKIVCRSCFDSKHNICNCCKI